MATDLTGHVTLVTGGNGGIGLGMAIGVGGGRCRRCHLGDDPGQERGGGNQLRETGRRVLTSICDVRDEEQVAEAFAGAVKEFGKVDSVFANAGVDMGNNPTFSDTWVEVAPVAF